jgi:hypothetical protein
MFGENGFCDDGAYTAWLRDTQDSRDQVNEVIR